MSVEVLRHITGLDDLVNADTLRRWFYDLNAGAANFGLDTEIFVASDRDESRYRDPDVFDMERTGDTHQAFGNGGHFCAGHFFARQVERVMLEELVTQLPNLRQRPDATPKVKGWVFRAPKVFQSLWDPVEVAPLEPAQHTAKPLFQPDNVAETLILQVMSMTVEAEDVLSVEFAHRDHKPLPAWEPGAHIDLWLANDRAAQYSLCGNPADKSRWTVAIKREPESRGISRFVHEKLRPGDLVAAGFPRSHFSLVDAPGYCFIAGGIGITPLLPMMEAVKATGTAMSVTYCGRRRSAMAFADRVEDLAGSDALVRRDTGSRADLAAVVDSAVKARQAIFVCGPPAMIAEVENLASACGAAVHSERFEGGQALQTDDFAFAVELVKSSRTLEVPADKTLQNTFDYLHATKAYLQLWGKPLAFYSDKHGVFRSTHASEKDRTSGLTQFWPALYELNIEIICANTPQAKGRVERANQTLQDRLVKEFRLRGIDTIEAPMSMRQNLLRISIPGSANRHAIRKICTGHWPIMRTLTAPCAARKSARCLRP